MKYPLINLYIAALTCFSLISVTACRKEVPPPETAVVQPAERAPVKTQTGLASYYAKSFDGQKTASGNKFSNGHLVAAHPSFPFGTLVRVTNLENNRSTEVTINDRGPSHSNVKEGVVIDLSQAAARELNMMHDGRVKVRLDVLSWGQNT